MKVLIFCTIVVVALISSEWSAGHSGGLNSQGCHGGSRPYHCHRAPSEMRGNRLRCDLGSRSKECINQRNTLPNVPAIPKPPIIKPLPEPKAPFVYSPTVPDMAELIENKALRIQIIVKIQERLKIQGYYSGSLDGIMGPKTMTAIDVFKIAKGLPLGGYLDQESLDALGVETN